MDDSHVVRINTNNKRVLKNKRSINNNIDDDRARARGSTSSIKDTVENPVIKKKILSPGELCDNFKQIIYQGNRPSEWITFDLFSKVELTAEECCKIIKYAQDNGKQIQKFTLTDPDVVRDTVLDLQNRVNRKPEKEYNPTQVTQDEFEANLAKKGFKIDYGN